MPDTPGMGVELNEEVVKKHLRDPGYFEPTPMYDNYIIRGYHTGRARGRTSTTTATGATTASATNEGHAAGTRTGAPAARS